jgi:RNA polymerase sigma-70 factor, ECF subfamily
MRVSTDPYKNDTDEALVQQLKLHVPGVFEELYARYAQKIFSYFFRMLWKNKELAEDCTQELFLKLIKHGAGFDATRNFSTWLYSIAHNMCKNEYRKAETKQRFSLQKPPEQYMPAQNNIDLKKFREEVMHCMDELDEDRRALFILRFQEQLTVPDISRILDIPEGTVKSRIFYLLKHLSSQLKTFESVHLQ